MSFRKCPESLWVNLHEPSERREPDETAEATIQQGFEVEELAADFFPDVEYIKSSPQEEARDLTAESMRESPDIPLTQATFISPRGCLVKCDYIEQANDGSWSIFEVKASTYDGKKPDKDHLRDLAFQRFTLEESGVQVGRTNLILLKKDEKSYGHLTADSILTVIDVTQQVSEILADRPLFIAEVEEALKVVRATPESGARRPNSCFCWMKSKGSRCEHFKLLNPGIPAFSAFDVRVHHSKAHGFYPPLHQARLYEVEQIPEELLSIAGKKADFVRAYKQRKMTYDADVIRQRLDALVYPLYFLDYETTSWALPRYDGSWPYHKIPFQYSLHILTAPPSSPHSKLLHREFLAQDRTCPIPALADTLASHIGPEGSVLVWNQSFEKSCNEKMGEFYPPSNDFMLDVNARVYDLMEIFQKDLYFDWRFEGSYSIKNVLPVLVPDLSYKGLEVSNGGEAMTRWPRVVFGANITAEERERTFEGLLEYCGLDTLAMVRIFEVLHSLTH